MFLSYLLISLVSFNTQLPYLTKYSVSLEPAIMMASSVTEDLVRCEVIFFIFVIAIFIAYFISDHKTEREIDDEYPVDV